MGSVAGTVAVISLIAGAVSTGISVSASNNAAAAQERIGNLNAMINLQNARMKAESAGAQAAFQNALNAKQAEAGRKNAENLRKQAGVTAAQARENSRRQREDVLRFQSTQNARFAKAGVTMVGTPMDVIADTAAKGKLMIAETAQQSEIQRRSLLNEAANAEAGAQMSLAVGGAQTAMDEAAARAGANADIMRAHLGQMEARSGAAAMRGQATASLVSGIGSAASSGYGYYKGIV